MSRLSDILGVKEGQEFRFGGDSPYRIVGDKREIYIYDKWYRSCSEENLCRMIAHPELIRIIPEKITLTEQQITAIKERIAEGTPWVARDKGSEKVWFYEDKPTECGGVGYSADGLSAPSLSCVYDFITFKNSPIYLPDLIEG
jgi:hypothetical protein